MNDDATGGALGESAAAGDRVDAGAVAGGGRPGARRSPYALAVALAELNSIGDPVKVDV